MRGLEGAEGLEAGQGLLCLDEASGGSFPLSSLLLLFTCFSLPMRVLDVHVFFQ